MTSARTLCTGLLTIWLLSGCTTHRIDIQQGNVIPPDAPQKIQLGMTPEQVQFILGTPLIIDPFHKNRWDYVYRMYRPWQPLEEQRVTVFFQDGKVVRILHDAEPQEAAGEASGGA